MKNMEESMIDFYKEVLKEQGKLIAEQSELIAFLKVMLKLQHETLNAQAHYVLKPQKEYLSVN